MDVIVIMSKLVVLKVLEHFLHVDLESAVCNGVKVSED